MQTISSLENSRLGEDAYVVGGGKSMDFYPPELFKDRFVLAVNQASRLVEASYIVRKENTIVSNDHTPVIASRHKAGCVEMGENKADYLFDHNQNFCHTISDKSCHPYGEKIIVSWSTITSAIHLAAYMGAKTIFLAGHDCATIDGSQVADGYYDGVSRLTPEQDYTKWLSVIAPQTAFLRDYLQKSYGVSLISLSPFIGLKHEGHIIA